MADFYKYHGLGNDYIVIDPNKLNFNLKLNEEALNIESPNISPMTSTESPLSPSKYGMTVDRDGNIYLANKSNKNILKFCP